MTDDKEPTLIDTLLGRRQKSPDERKLVPGNLLDVLFKRRRDQEDSYDQIRRQEEH